jgi:hypothetical protein
MTYHIPKQKHLRGEDLTFKHSDDPPEKAFTTKTQCFPRFINRRTEAYSDETQRASHKGEMTGLCITSLLDILRRSCEHTKVQFVQPHQAKRESDDLSTQHRNGMYKSMQLNSPCEYPSCEH